MQCRIHYTTKYAVEICRIPRGIKKKKKNDDHDEVYLILTTSCMMNTKFFYKEGDVDPDTLEAVKKRTYAILKDDERKKKKHARNPDDEDEQTLQQMIQMSRAQQAIDAERRQRGMHVQFV